MMYNNPRNIRSLLAVGLAVGLSATAGGAEGGTTKVGWVFANQPNATSPYTPDTVFSYNSFAGNPGQVGVNPKPAGEPVGGYEVQFAQFGNTFSNIQVTPYGGSGYCMAAFDSSPAGIVCFDAAGNLANTAFTLLYQTRTTGCCSPAHTVAFVGGGWTYNTTGAKNSYVHNGIGSYTVNLPGLTNSGGHVQVTTYIHDSPTGGFIPARCNTTDWHADATGTTINVACVDKNGAAIDTNFMLAYSYGATLGAHAVGGTNIGAYTFANQPSQTKRYYAGNHFQYNGFGGGPLPIQRTGTGTYTVSVPGAKNYSSSTALVSAIGPGGTYCNLASFSGATTMNVACFAQGGVPTDSKFELTFQTAP